MAAFNVREVDLRVLNSLTKYPSIPTYHSLDPKNGNLGGGTITFGKTVIGTEKIDGTNGRIIFLPDGTYLIGSREELLYASGDLLANPMLGIVNALRPIADNWVRNGATEDLLLTMYVEVYGGNIGRAAKQYTQEGNVGVRLFDAMSLHDIMLNEMITWSVERVAAWRDSGYQPFAPEDYLIPMADALGVQVAPRLFRLEPEQLPTTVEDAAEFLAQHAPSTLVALDTQQPVARDGGRAEGIVLRTEDRSTIAKLRHEDYIRTLARRGQ